MKKISKKILNKTIKIVMLMTIIFSSFQTPIYVFADEISEGTSTQVQYEEGDMRLGETGLVEKDGTVTVQAGAANLNTDGNVQVTKTVSKVEEGKYKVDFLIQGKDVQNVVTTTKPIYFVIVFDTSGSMICDSDEYSYSVVVENNEHYTAADGTKIRCVSQNYYEMEYALTQSKWENAIDGAINFATQLTSMDNTYVSLVTFSSSASRATNFKHGTYEESDFGYPAGGTNLSAAIDQAQSKLDTITNTEAQKYILVISDGEPNSIYDTQVSANEAKDKGTKIYSIGYGINENSSADDVLKYISSNTTVTPGQYPGVQYTDNGYYQISGTDGLTSALETVFESVGEPSKAGTNATLIDGIGGQFKIVTENDEEVSGYGVSYVNSNIAEITENGTTLSFYIQINEDAETGWYNTNANFSLTYTDANKETQTINSNQNPQVYWVQKQYDYIVNYYKDSIAASNLLASETRQAPNNTVIDASNVEKDKYLNQAGEGYEFNSVTPTSITITNDGETKTINVLYTTKKYSYNVNYYYDNELDTELSHTVINVNHGTVVESESYYLTANEIKEGYKLDGTNTSKGNIVVDSFGKVINIYYIKDAFEFEINYHFNGILNSGLTKNETATYEEIIKAEDNYLTDKELVENNYSDYFLHPTIPADPTQIQIGTNSENNILNIYYINTFVTNENIDKTTPENPTISSSQEVVKYQVEYISTAKNVKAGEKITITIVDTLPYEIDETKSNLSNGIYNSSNKTITWTIEKNVTEFTENYSINEVINYEVVYKDFADISAEEYNKLQNNVIGKTTVANKTTQGVSDNIETPVEIYGSLTVKHVDESQKDLVAPVTDSKKVGTNYTTEAKTIYGYTLKENPINATGTYTEEGVTVTYVYTKNKGTEENVEKNEVVKTQTNPIIGANSTFNYILTYQGKVTDYVGTATVTLKDTLPNEVLSINYDTSACTYEATTRLLTCTKTVELNQDNQLIEARFNVNVTYKNLASITDLPILNKVESTLEFDDIKITEDDEITDTVKAGTVIAKYVDETDNQLAESKTTTGLINTDYITEAKTIYGYTLKENPINATGTYTEDKITVTYVYTKNSGTTEKNEVTKIGPENVTNINGVFNYTLTYNGKITDYVGEATLTLKDTLPYEIDETLSSYDDRCIYQDKVLTCTGIYDISEEKTDISDNFNLSIVFKNINLDKVTNKVESTLDYGKDTPDTSEDETETEVFKGTVVATYKNTVGETLAENITQVGLAGNNYEVEALEFLGYTLTKVPTNQEGIYVANETIYVNYVYAKNIGTSEEHLEKQGTQKVTDINSPFEYKILYKLEILDYVGDVKITLTDHLPYEIDLEKSVLGDVCEYADGKLECIYLHTITTKENSKINIEENLVLYYKNITSNKVTNRVESLVVYGEEEKYDEDEFTTEIPSGTVKVNYVTDKGEILSQSIITTSLAGAEYATEQKVFDNYYLKEVYGETTGVYTEEEIEVTYVYSEIPLPPQTGVENNFTNYIGLFIFVAVLLVLKRRYL